MTTAKKNEVFTEQSQFTDASKNNLTDNDFYGQACAYFYYHAEQRTTMINYFIAVFGASIALYGSLLSNYAWVSVLVSVFITIVSLIFFFIDLRNRFDVKQSQNVIEQIEADYEMNVPRGKYCYGVFSNEANVYHYYGILQKKRNCAGYKKLKKLYKKVERNKATEALLDEQIELFISKDPTVSHHEIKKSLGSGPIISLSLCIKTLYILCTIISVMAFLLSLLLALGIV